MNKKSKAAILLLILGSSLGTGYLASSFIQNIINQIGEVWINR